MKNCQNPDEYTINYRLGKMNEEDQNREGRVFPSKVTQQVNQLHQIVWMDSLYSFHYSFTLNQPLSVHSWKTLCGSIFCRLLDYYPKPKLCYFILPHSDENDDDQKLISPRAGYYRICNIFIHLSCHSSDIAPSQNIFRMRSWKAVNNNSHTSVFSAVVPKNE